MNLVIDIGIVLFKALVVITALLTLTALLSWVERKQSAVMQDRVGPNRANILGFRVFGLFHIIADAVKMIMKEDYVVPGANRFLHSLAPFLSLTMPLIVFCAIPFGDTLNILGKVIPLQVVNINAGLLFILAIGSLSAYGAVLGGISSNNNYALLGGLRAMAQTISYEVVLGPALLGVIIVFNSLDLNEIVRAQGELIFGWIPKWGIVVQPLAFLIFLVAAMAETKRAHFDIP
jgi:NADH-quinone oxidoreductase subunit H